MITLTELCAELNNWFTQKEDKIIGDFTIENQTIDIDGEIIDRGLNQEPLSKGGE